MAKYLVTVATTVYNDITIDANSREDAWAKAHDIRPNYGAGQVYETPYIENIEELRA